MPTSLAALDPSQLAGHRRARPRRVPVFPLLGRKALAVLLRATHTAASLAYRALPPFTGKLRGVDHVTLPCGDLTIAEAFYVGLLGARVLMRVDEAFLRRMKRPEDEIEKGVHLSLVFAGGPRIDLFRGDDQAPLLAGHPHLAFWVSCGQMLAWQEKLARAGVPTDGPRQLGPPGQASLYFNDPFGNHLELVTCGYPYEIVMGASDMAKLAYAWRGLET